MIYYFLACVALIVACACFVGIVFASVRTTSRGEIRRPEKQGSSGGRDPARSRALRSDD